MGIVNDFKKVTLFVFIASTAFGISAANAQDNNKIGDGILGKVYSCRFNKEIHKDAASEDRRIKFDLSKITHGKFGSKVVNNIVFDEKNKYWTAQLYENTGEIRYTIAFKMGSITLIEKEGSRRAYFLCEEDFSTTAQNRGEDERRATAKTISKLNIDLRRTNIEEVDRLKSLLITEISDDVMREAIYADQNWQKTGQINNQRVSFDRGFNYARVKGIVDRLLDSVNIDSKQWAVRVVDTEEKTENAFVTGGRIIYVYTGLIESARSDDELAFVLGHEIGHSLLKHNKERVDNEWASIVGSLSKLGAMFSKNEGRRDAFEFVGDAITTFYGRDHEREADAFGAYIANRAGYRFSEGRNFFMRSLRQMRAFEAQNERQITQIAQQINSQFENCELQKQQYNANPLYRTRANAEIVNRTCQQAIQNQERLQFYQKQRLKNIFTRTHPVDEERISNLDMINSYMTCRIGDQGIESIGVGSFVLRALDFKPQCR